MKFESLDEAYAVLLKLIDDFTSGKINFDEFEWAYQDAHMAYERTPGAQIAEGFFDDVSEWVDWTVDFEPSEKSREWGYINADELIEKIKKHRADWHRGITHLDEDLD